MKRALAMLPLALAGCATAQTPVEPAPTGKCDAKSLTSVVGQTASEQLGAEILRRSGAARLRWISPGMMVTMEYRDDRVNVKLGPDNKVAAITCS